MVAFVSWFLTEISEVMYGLRDQGPNASLMGVSRSPGGLKLHQLAEGENTIKL